MTKRRSSRTKSIRSLMSQEGLTLEQHKTLARELAVTQARSNGIFLLLAATYPNHVSKIAATIDDKLIELRHKLSVEMAKAFPDHVSQEDVDSIYFPDPEALVKQIAENSARMKNDKLQQEAADKPKKKRSSKKAQADAPVAADVKVAS